MSDNTHDGFTVLPSLALRPSDRKTSLSILKTFSENHYVSYSTLIISVGIIVGAVAAEALLIINTSDYAKWAWPAWVLFPIGALGMTLLMMLPSDSVNSKLSNAFSYGLSRMSRSGAPAKPLGVDAVDDDIIRFADGTVGAAFNVSGVLAQSTLKSVLDLSASGRQRWLIRRPSASTSLLMASLAPADFSSQMEALSSVEGEWGKAMAGKVRAYIENKLHTKSRTVEQTFIIRESSERLLERSMSDAMRTLRGATFMGFRRLSGDALESRLDSVTSSAMLVNDSPPAWGMPSCMIADGKCVAVADLVQLPNAVSLSLSQMVDIVPVPSNDVELHFIVSDSLIAGDEKSELIRKNATGGKESVKNDEYDDATADKIDVARNDIAGYTTYERDMQVVDPLVAFKIRLVIVAKSPEVIDVELADQNTLLAETVRGFRWELLTSETKSTIEHLLDDTTLDRSVMTSTTTEYSKLELSVSAGLDDASGVPIGVESESIVSSVAMMDFESSLERQAIIAAPSSSRAVSYQTDTLSSVVAQAVANSCVFAGHRVQHLSLSGFTYDSDEYFKPDGARQVIDVSSSTVNPLQGFGPIDDVVNIFSRLVDKLTKMFDALTDLQMTTDDLAIVKGAIRAFYYNQGLWTANAAEKPRLTRITEISDPSTYPTMVQLLNELSSLAKTAAVESRENRADKIDTIESLLRQALTTYMPVLGKTTNIAKPEAEQVYYDFSGIPSPTIKQIQFMNIIDYCLSHAASGDVIVIHALEEISEPVLLAVQPSLSAAQQKGVRIVFAFDTVTSQNSETLSQLQSKSDFSTLRSIMYRDMDFDVDFSVIGKCLPDEVDVVESCLNTKLSQTIKHNMLSKSPSSVLVHRRKGGVNTFVSVNPVI